jgi:hypothetical protein
MCFRKKWAVKSEKEWDEREGRRVEGTAGKGTISCVEDRSKEVKTMKWEARG